MREGFERDLLVPCPVCKVGVGLHCINAGKSFDDVHPERVAKYEELQAKAKEIKAASNAT